MSIYLSIDRCARHNFYAISIDDEDSGRRVTPSKCCGSWSTVKQWRLSERDWRELAEEASKAAESVAKESA